MSYPLLMVQVLLLLIVIPAALYDYGQRRVSNWIFSHFPPSSPNT
jgi:hypothetical protein